MPRLMRIAAVMFGSLGLLTISACMAVSGPNGFGTASPFTGSLFGNSSASYSSNGSSFGASSSAGSSLNSGAGPYASSSRATSSGSGADTAVPPGYSADGSQSSALTNYLQKNRLPLVGGQVMSNSSGNREVILYGFVATDFGKQDAVDKVHRYLGDPNLPVINRIDVRPELLASGGSGASSSSSATGSPSSGSYSSGGLGSVQSYENQAQQAQTQQYVQNQSALSTLVPLIGMMGGMLSFGGGGVGMGYGGYPYGSPYSPFGMPYSPYGMAPYGSPYGSPFGYGGYGGGFTFP